MSNPSLYDYPLIYDRVRTPDQDTFDTIFNLICDYLGRKPGSVMDPACGPATWMAPFAQKGVMVAGNDIDPNMIKAAREKCGDRVLELIEGDMCDLRFAKGPFDVTFELAGTCGMLPGEEKFLSFLKSSIKHTADKGLMLLTVFFQEVSEYDQFPWLVGEWGPFAVPPQGNAWLRYEVLSTLPESSIDRVRRVVHTSGVEECQVPLIDEYDMFSWKEERFWDAMADFKELQFLTAFRYDEPVGIEPCGKGRLSGETTVVFRKRAV